MGSDDFRCLCLRSRQIRTNDVEAIVEIAESFRSLFKGSHKQVSGFGTHLQEDQTCQTTINEAAEEAAIGAFVHVERVL